jgi:hypothetical protein
VRLEELFAADQKQELEFDITSVNMKDFVSAMAFATTPRDRQSLLGIMDVKDKKQKHVKQKQVMRNFTASNGLRVIKKWLSLEQVEESNLVHKVRPYPHTHPQNYGDTISRRSLTRVSRALILTLHEQDVRLTMDLMFHLPVDEEETKKKWVEEGTYRTLKDAVKHFPHKESLKGLLMSLKREWQLKAQLSDKKKVETVVAPEKGKPASASSTSVPRPTASKSRTNSWDSLNLFKGTTQQLARSPQPEMVSRSALREE